MLGSTQQALLLSTLSMTEKMTLRPLGHHFDCTAPCQMYPFQSRPGISAAISTRYGNLSTSCLTYLRPDRVQWPVTPDPLRIQGLIRSYNRSWHSGGGNRLNRVELEYTSLPVQGLLAAGIGVLEILEHSNFSLSRTFVQHDSPISRPNHSAISLMLTVNR